MKNYLIKLYDFAVVCIAVLAIIGGTAYLFYDRHFLFGVTNLLLAGLATPYIISRVKDIMNWKDESAN